jgi:enoyl-[acyl-carrier protein] reductase/trans-2-enoyl-CoA reductase (NAD+)
MIISPKVRGFICTTAHPTGCFEAVRRQIDYVKHQPRLTGPRNVLIIGASTGYGLASRIVTGFSSGAKTLGVAFERPASDKRTASPGWYNTAAFETLAHEQGLYATSIMGDAFSTEIKQQTIERIKSDLGQIDCLIYSLAAPMRVHPVSGHKFQSTLKPIGQNYTNKTVDTMTGEVKTVTLTPASEEEIANTVAVMGGEDWAMWVLALQAAGVLSDDFITMAYNYQGPVMTHPIYKNGTIGRAKDHLLATAHQLDKQLRPHGGQAFLSVNKALVTQASAAIPVVPLYISILYKIMKEQGTHEGCIEQIYRLFGSYVYEEHRLVDDTDSVRIDDWEMQPDIQQKIMEIWPQVTTENVEALTDIAGYRQEFYRLFGFDFENVDYNAEVNPEVAIASIPTEVVST